MANLIKISNEMLSDMLRMHALFLENNPKGQKLTLKQIDFGDMDLSLRDLRGVEIRDSSFRNTRLNKTDLTNANLDNCDFSGANMRNIILFRASMRGAKLDGADISQSLMNEADLREASVLAKDKNTGEISIRYISKRTEAIGTNFEGSSLENARLNCVNAKSANFLECSVRGAILRDANLESANMKGAILEAVDFSGAVLKGAKFQDSVMTRAIFANSFPDKDATEGAIFTPDSTTIAGSAKLMEMADLHEEWWETMGKSGKGADFCGKDVRPLVTSFSHKKLTALKAKNLQAAGVSFVGTQLQGADFRNADLRGVCFREADLRGADFSDCKLMRADFTKANLQNLELSAGKIRETKFSGANLRYANFTGALINRENLSDADTRGVNFGAAKPH